jgi:hypothetical protein
LQTDTTFKALIRPFAKSLADGGRQPVHGCTPEPHAAPAAPASPQVQSFSDGRKPPTSGRKLLG